MSDYTVLVNVSEAASKGLIWADGRVLFRLVPVSALQPGQRVLIAGTLATIETVAFNQGIITIYPADGSGWNLPPTALVLAAEFKDPYETAS